MSHILGLDIGGANIKAATAEGRAVSMPFALWKTPDRLHEPLKTIAGQFPPTAVAVTMTGELCDCFPGRAEGVRHIVAAVRSLFDVPTGFWGTDGRFHEDEVPASRVASANWHALASLVARTVVPTGLLVDIGSTTADFIPFADGKPCPLGTTDAERLRSGELVYTGVRRTPVCSLLGTAGAAEWFATTDDVYLVLGDVNERPDDRDTCDGRPATREFARARLARMLCEDPECFPTERGIDLARTLRERQLASLPRHGPRPWVLAGEGEFLARALAERAGVTQLHSLRSVWDEEISRAACAYAVARLWAAGSRG